MVLESVCLYMHNKKYIKQILSSILVKITKTLQNSLIVHNSEELLIYFPYNTHTYTCTYRHLRVFPNFSILCFVFRFLFIFKSQLHSSEKSSNTRTSTTFAVKCLNCSSFLSTFNFYIFFMLSLFYFCFRHTCAHTSARTVHAHRR